MAETEKIELKNTYVKDYYDTQVGEMTESYTDYRWNSSATGRFDHAQTTRALKRALGGRFYKSAVEIGPGDGVWTRLLGKQVRGTLHLVEQSEAMLSKAKKRLTGVAGISFEHADWQQAKPPKEVDLIFAIRCFEYFTDKPGGLKKMFDTLKPGGRLVLVTKNADLYTTFNVQGKTLHSDQVTKPEMVRLLTEAGFSVKAVYPATLRWKIKYAVPRFVFSGLQRLAVCTNGLIVLPVLTKRATESYTYVAFRP